MLEKKFRSQNPVITAVPALLLLIMLFTSCSGEKNSGTRDNMPQLINLFVNGTNGYFHYRIPGIVVTRKGTILAYCEARKSGSGDWGDIDILMRRSADGGKSWSDAKLLVDASGKFQKNPVALKQNLAQPEEITANNPVAVVDWQTGLIHFLYCIEYGRCFYMNSDDDGQSFSEPVEITGTFEKFRTEYDWKVLATGPGHGIQLTGGRLIVPVWLSTGTGGHAHRPSAVSVIYSDDHGKTWNGGEIITRDTPAAPNPSETYAVELQDGRVMVNMRNESEKHRRLISFSPDGANGWSEPVFDEELFEPVCMASIIRLSKQPEHDRNRILFVNPDSRQSTPKKGSISYPRENLTIKLSYDEAETWQVSKVLDPGASGYSDLSVGPDNTIYCFYERGAIKGNHYSIQYLTCAQFTLNWLTNGKDSF